MTDDYENFSGRHRFGLTREPATTAGWPWVVLAVLWVVALAWVVS